ncbi:MAG: HigA family addiction module antitoxin [Bradyrhizobium sp.]|jgi:addiction module HigA family antidote|uniref:Addiction module antidote protein, HigA family n=1 Tax=Mesorhizobium denitrificans TaxID=2294114 RepID=A0A371XJP6_9HYPH|nr:HigA family addiction module antitoxin [Mesorhizobium denitrificans]MCU0730318.1 HigA family addiction module antitoxin [Hyphomonas sp.]RFC69452.1 addiction module antidote protein, HigA family [Mesorhizobium denitrificans]TXH33430.1 MAG: addiction module antidote protein, HigA family [Rhodospirillaceae bacterium]
MSGNRMKSPAHPGGFVKAEVIGPLGLSVTAAADALGVTRAALSALLNERADLSPEMAIRIEKAFGISMETLMRMQNSFDIAEARKKAKEVNVAPYAGKASE